MRDVKRTTGQYRGMFPGKSPGTLIHPLEQPKIDSSRGLALL